jgi:large subunit ribosomal protein L24
MQKKLHVKVGDTVKVISGTSKGSEGKIQQIDRSKNRVIVEGVNVVKKTREAKCGKSTRWNRGN